MCLLAENHYLFTGDHLWWSRTLRSLNAGRDVCWYSWEEQTRSMAALERFTFEWILPGHGERMKLSTDEAKKQVQALVQRMRP